MNGVLRKHRLLQCVEMDITLSGIISVHWGGLFLSSLLVFNIEGPTVMSVAQWDALYVFYIATPSGNEDYHYETVTGWLFYRL
jgi:hypothetical protein